MQIIQINHSMIFKIKLTKIIPKLIIQLIFKIKLTEIIQINNTKNF